MENSGGRRLLVPLQGPVNGGGGATGGASFAVLQFVGYAHSPLPSPTAHPSPTLVWSSTPSPVPSPRTPTSALESPKLHTSAQPAPQVHQQQQQQVATTFVQADTSSFKEVVQKLTGATDEKKLPITMPARYAPRSGVVAAPPVEGQKQQQQAEVNGGAAATRFDVGPRKPAFKLHERRRNLRSLGINPPAFRVNGRMSPRAAPELLSPSMLDLPSLVLSPVTPLGGDPFECCPSTSSNEASPTEEEKAMAEKGYYLHPSPLTKPRDKPQLLPLFPLSPREPPSESSS